MVSVDGCGAVGVAKRPVHSAAQVPQAALAGHFGESLLSEGGELFFAVDHDQAGPDPFELVEQDLPSFVERGGEQFDPTRGAACLAASGDDGDGQVQRDTALGGAGSFAGAVEQQHRHTGDTAARSEPVRCRSDQVTADRASRHLNTADLGHQPGCLHVGDLDSQRRGCFGQLWGSALPGRQTEQLAQWREPAATRAALDHRRPQRNHPDQRRELAAPDLSATTPEPAHRCTPRACPRGCDLGVVVDREPERATHLSEQLSDHRVDRRPDQLARRASSELECCPFQGLDANQLIDRDEHAPCNFQTRQRGSFSFARADGAPLPTSPATTPMSSQRLAT